MSLSPHAVSVAWFSLLTDAIEKRDSHAVANTMLPEGWLRDILVFGWDLRALEGRDKIAAHISHTLLKTPITDLRLEDSPDLSPRSFPADSVNHNGSGIELAFNFELPHGSCRGHARLLQDVDGVFRALTLMVTLLELRGHEETSLLSFRDDFNCAPGRDTQKEYTDWVHSVETDPFVLIIGAAQTGLQIAARFKQNGINALVIDRLPRVGDSWRVRYPSLSLHTTRKHTTFLYQPYPTNWPILASRDKFADWLEHYASIQDLVVWTSTELNGHPKYDSATRRWTATLLRGGTTEVTVSPAHIVVATGTVGRPVVPNVPNIELFRGRTLHSSAFPGGAPFAGQRAVVVGMGNSAIDVAQDLALRGAASVTMVQRSPTCVIGRDFFCDTLHTLFPEERAIDASDLRFFSMPLGLYKKICIASQDATHAANAELHAKLRKGGVDLHDGPEGEGVYVLFYQRGGGYWLDKGGADLIADGTIQIKSNVSLKYFTEHDLVLSDGSQLTADVVIFATGAQNIRDSNAEMLGDEVMSKTGPAYGLDKEGEINGSYRPCGHPGLWFATGDIPMSRFFSKALALQIKAIELGLNSRS